MRVAALVLFAGCRVGFDATARVDDGPRGDDGALAPPTVYVTSGDVGSPTHLLTLELATGKLVDLGSLGFDYPLGGLSYWDANTLYACGSADLIEISLSPFGAMITRSVGGTISAFDRDGGDLIGIDQSMDAFARFKPTGTVMRTPVLDTNNTPIPANGGDIAQMPDGSWRWWSNTRTQLYRLDVATAHAIEIGPPQTITFISGMVIDRAGRLFLVGNGNNTLIELDPDTGAMLGSIPLCVGPADGPCDAAANLLSGDAARSP